MVDKEKKLPATRKGKKRKSAKKTQNALVDLRNVVVQKNLIPEWLRQYASIFYIALAVGSVSGLGYLMWNYWSWGWLLYAAIGLVAVFFLLGLLIELWTSGLIWPLAIGAALEVIGETWQLNWVQLVGHFTLMGAAIAAYVHFRDYNTKEESERAAKAIEKYKEYLISSGFWPQMCFVSSDYVSFIALDQSNEKIALANMNKGFDHIVDISDILSVDVSEDGHRSFEINATTSGTSGLSIGATSSRGISVGRSWTGSQEVQGTLNEAVLVRDIGLVLETSDVEFPHISLNLLGKTAALKESLFYSKTLKEAKTWAARIRALQHKNEHSARVKNRG